MTPPAAARSAARRSAAARPRPRARAGGATVTRPVAPRVPRRVSGPARARPAPRPVRRPGSRQLSVPARVIRALIALPDRAVVDRLTRGRSWIAVIGVGLIGIVAMQVSLLGMNAGIGRSVERSAELERRNGELRAEVSQLSAGERIQSKAAALGMVLPPAGQVRYRDARGGSDAQVAADALRAGAFSTPADVPATDDGATGAESTPDEPGVAEESGTSAAASAQDEPITAATDVHADHTAASDHAATSDTAAADQGQ